MTSSALNLARRTAVSVVGIFAFSVFTATHGFGQALSDTARTWSWSRVRAIEGVDERKVDWLAEHAPNGEDVQLLELVDSLSDPGAAQLLVGRFLQDPSFYYLQAWPEIYNAAWPLVLDSLAGRPPVGDAGVVHVAYILGRIREIITQAYSRLPYYVYTFEDRRLHLDPSAVPENRIMLDLDVSPAEQLLDLLSFPETTPAMAADRLGSDVFAALVQHRSQSFYPVSVSVESLALNLARAAGDEPLDRLYRYAYPVGLMHYAAVREHLDDFRSVVRTIGRNEAAIVAHIKGAILPYLPEDVALTRTVHFLFADGADGWYADGVVGVDLEYFADDYDKLLNILVHETYHAAQDAVREPGPDLGDDRFEHFGGVLETIFREGTANFVAPTDRRSEAEAMEAAQRGSELLASYHDVLFAEGEIDEAELQRIQGEGVRGSGPFYWLGRAMAQTIVEQFGAEGLARTLPGGGITFARIYLSATAQEPGDEPLLSRKLVATLERMD